MCVVLSKCRVLVLILITTVLSSVLPAGAEPSASVLQGYDLLAKHSYSQAISVLTGAVRANPRDAMARRYLGIALHHAGNSTSGAQQMEIAIRLEPGNANDLAALAEMYLLSGEHIKAISSYRSCLTMAPANEQARCGLAKAYYGAGDAANARSTCIDGLRCCRNSNTRKQLSRILGNLRDSERPAVEADARG